VSDRMLGKEESALPPPQKKIIFDRQHFLQLPLYCASLLIGGSLPFRGMQHFAFPTSVERVSLPKQHNAQPLREMIIVKMRINKNSVKKKENLYIDNSARKPLWHFKRCKLDF